MEGAAAQDFRGAAVGGATGGKDEVLDAEEVALYQQDFFAVFSSVATQPQGGGERGGGFAVVVKGDVGAVRGGNGVGDALPEGIKVVEPQRPVVVMGFRDVAEAVKEGLPEVGVGAVAVRENAEWVERRARVVCAGVACGSVVFQADGCKERAQFCRVGAGFGRAGGDLGGVCDEVL